MSATATATATTASSSNTDTPRITRSEIPEIDRYLACVKWFDNTLSYGFATILEGEHSGKDTFVHQSNIITDKEEIYRSLKKGEYVEFAIEPSENTTHQFQANYVTGLKKGPLMCETNFNAYVDNPTSKRRYPQSSRGRGRGNGFRRRNNNINKSN